MIHFLENGGHDNMLEIDYYDERYDRIAPQIVFSPNGTDTIYKFGEPFHIGHIFKGILIDCDAKIKRVEIEFSSCGKVFECQNVIPGQYIPVTSGLILSQMNSDMYVIVTVTGGHCVPTLKYKNNCSYFISPGSHQNIPITFFGNNKTYMVINHELNETL